MTKDEALQILDTIPTIGEQVDALEMAIEALEQQPITTTNNDEPITVIYPTIVCDDAVSRQAALNSLIDNTHLDGYDLAEALDAIENKEKLPSVKHKYGKWILADEQNKEDVENDNYRFICSECQCSDIHAKGSIVPYCWKCGAKMQESEVSNE